MDMEVSGNDLIVRLYYFTIILANANLENANFRNANLGLVC